MKQDVRGVSGTQTHVDDVADSRDLALIILAAGRGSRLEMEAAKWLLDIQGKPIAEWQYEAFEQLPPRLFNRRLLVAGYQSSEIREYLASASWQIEILENPNWGHLNNWYSMLLALRYLDEEGFGGDVMFVNADLIASPHHFAELINWVPSADSLLGVLVDFGAELDDEAMKVELNSSGRVSRVGKVGLSVPCAECIGSSRLTAAGRRRVREIFEGFSGDAARTNCWYDEAYNILVQESVHIKGAVSLIACPPGHDWIEIDDQADLARAQVLHL